MAYIGNSPANVGNYQIVDDISSSFNGSLTTFALTVLTLAINPAKSGQLLVNINGVPQEPDDTGTDGFLVSGSNIVFSSAPASGDTFWSVWQGQAVDIGTPSDDVVDTAHIKDDAVTAAKLANSINTEIAANTAKTGITTAQASAITANTAKVTNSTSASDLTSGTLPSARLGTIAGFTSTGIDDNATSTAITIDSSENVGIGVTPEAWHSSYTGFQIAQSTSLMSNTDAAGNLTWFGNNFYYDGTRKYTTTDEASVYEQTAGTHKFNVAASGSADAAITWTTGLEVLNAGQARAKNGLLFGTDTAAANALDDYEEGTWTPTLYAAGGNSATFTLHSASYTKIGSVVVVHSYIHSINLAAMTSGNYILLGGLPFSSNGYGDFSISYRDAGFDSTTIVGGYTQSGSAHAYFMNGAGAEVQQSGAYNTSKMMITITYNTTS